MNIRPSMILVIIVTATIEKVTTSCSTEEAPCEDGKCIQATLFCDGTFDCSDQSDELPGCCSTCCHNICPEGLPQCDYPLCSCVTEKNDCSGTTEPSTETTVTSTSDSPDATVGAPVKTSTNTGLIIGVVVGILVLIITGFIIYCVWRKCCRTRGNTRRNQVQNLQQSTDASRNGPNHTSNGEILTGQNESFSPNEQTLSDQNESIQSNEEILPDQNIPSPSDVQTESNIIEVRPLPRRLPPIVGHKTINNLAYEENILLNQTDYDSDFDC